jgi:formate hydrogenlyase transcriptional activator
MSAVAQTAFETPASERYEALLRLSQTLISKRCSEKLFSTLARELREVVNFDHLGVSIYDEKLHEVRFKIFNHSGTPIPAPKLAPEESLTWWVYQHQQPLVIPAVDEETRFPASLELFKKNGIRSFCALPLTTVHRRLGALGLGSQEADAYSSEEVRFLSLVANQVALAVDDCLNHEASVRAQEELQQKQAELERKRDRLQLLLDVTNRMVSNLELRDLLREISASVRRLMQCDGVAVALPDSEGHQLRVYAVDFPESKGLITEGRLIPIDKSPLGTAFQTGEAVVMNHSDLLEVDPEVAVIRAGEGIKCSCFIPLVSRNRSAGVLALARLGESAFSPNDVGFLAQVAGQVAIAVENAAAYRQIADLKDKLAQEKLYLEDEIRTDLHFEEILGESAALRRALEQVYKVASTDSTVLIYGETGTGKELIARAIHDRSVRCPDAFVKLNCAAIPTGLLESELFGHEKGAFTGAIAQRIGRFELANRGTIFLDEIGEIPLELQPKLLRVLQEREFERLGSSRTLRTDARLIAATNRDLAAEVREQRFRADLFYRLNVFPVHVPPLRERSEDIPLLVRHFAQEFSRRMNKGIDTIPSETLKALVRYQWPGNIRELQNVIERAVILSTGPVLKVPLSELKQLAVNGNGGSGRQDTLEEAERKHILRALEDSNWVLAGPHGAAARLGMKRSTLQYRMAKLGIARTRELAPKAFSSQPAAISKSASVP